MPFYPPAWVPKLPFDPPDTISVADFVLDENYERHPLGYSHAPFTCGLSGKSYSAIDVRERVDYLARGLAKELGFEPNTGSEWDKVIAVYSLNTVSSNLVWSRECADRRRLIPFLWHGPRIGSAGFSLPPMQYIMLPSSNIS